MAAGPRLLRRRRIRPSRESLSPSSSLEHKARSALLGTERRARPTHPTITALPPLLPLLVMDEDIISTGVAAVEERTGPRLLSCFCVIPRDDMRTHIDQRRPLAQVNPASSMSPGLHSTRTRESVDHVIIVDPSLHGHIVSPSLLLRLDSHREHTKRSSNVGGNAAIRGEGTIGSVTDNPCSLGRQRDERPQHRRRGAASQAASSTFGGRCILEHDGRDNHDDGGKAGRVSRVVNDACRGRPCHRQRQTALISARHHDCAWTNRPIYLPNHESVRQHLSFPPRTWARGHEAEARWTGTYSVLHRKQLAGERTGTMIATRQQCPVACWPAACLTRARRTPRRCTKEGKTDR